MRKFFAFLLILALMNFTFLPSLEVFASNYINVTLSPNIANTQNSITIQLKFDDVDIGSNTTIEIGLDEGSDQSTKLNIPSSFSTNYIKLQYGNTTITPSSASLSPVYYSGGYAYRLKIVTLIGTNIPRGNNFSIVIDKEANIYPKTTGSHSLFVIVSGHTLFANYTVGSSSTSQSITINSITVGTPKLSETSTYTFVFTSGVNLVTNDKITVQFPQGFKVPSTIDGSNFALIQGSSMISTFAGNVDISSNLITLTIPTTSYIFYANSSITLKFGLFTGIYNPSTAGDYEFQMWTSKQTTPASYKVTLGTKITNLLWNVSQKVEQAVSEHTITFNTSSTGNLSTSDKIIIVFPDNFTLPSQIPSGSITVNNTIAKVGISSNSLIIAVPVSIGNSSLVTIKITPDAKVINPPTNTTGYKIKVYTTADQLPVESPAVVFTPSTVQNVLVSISPQVVNKPATISISFTTGSGGALAPNDNIYITFPHGFTLPTQISSNFVSINVGSKSYHPSSVTVSRATSTISLIIPSNLTISGGESVGVVFDTSANIVTPQTSGQFKIKASTSKETTIVESAIFEIFAYPKSSIVLTPSNPDGHNGYYITQPTISFSVSEIAGTKITLYYKINDASYQTYDLVNKPQIKIPEGKITVYFYAEDSFGNKEPENSKTILVDLSDPVITISTPQENSIVVQSTYTLKGSIKTTDIASSVLTVDGKAVQISSDGSFETLITLPKEGINTTVIKVVSSSGRSATKQFSINYIARVTILLQIGNDKAYINGEQVAIDAPPFISGGNVMVPLRFILTSFKATLHWDKIFQIISLNLGNNSMRLQIGNLRADVNGQLKMLPTAPVLVKGITFVPLRFISENFGAEVNWDGKMRVVNIVYPKP